MFFSLNRIEVDWGVHHTTSFSWKISKVNFHSMEVFFLYVAGASNLVNGPPLS